MVPMKNDTIIEYAESISRLAVVSGHSVRSVADKYEFHSVDPSMGHFESPLSLLCYRIEGALDASQYRIFMAESYDDLYGDSSGGSGLAGHVAIYDPEYFDVASGKAPISTVCLTNGEYGSLMVARYALEHESLKELLLPYDRKNVWNLD
ncbi:MAG: hypothetical protein ACI83O_000217 [Patescibacteria group bacterium]|jgi:hypothetical protein